MINPEDFRPYSEVYNYEPAPIMPGIRRLADAEEERYRLDVELPDEPLNFIPSYVPRYNNPQRFYYAGLGAPTCGGMTPEEEMVEGFAHGMIPRFWWRLLILILIIALIYYLSNKQ